MLNITQIRSILFKGFKLTALYTVLDPEFPIARCFSSNITLFDVSNRGKTEQLEHPFDPTLLAQRIFEHPSLTGPLPVQFYCLNQNDPQIARNLS